MKKIVLAVLLITGGIVVAGQAAYACTCSINTPAAFAKRVEYLIEGKVLSVTVRNGKQYTTIRVSKIIKAEGGLIGKSISKILVVTSAVGTCGYRFRKSGVVRFFALAAGPGHYRTNYCLMAPLVVENWGGRSKAEYIEAVKASSAMPK